MAKRFLFLITHYYPVVYGAELFAKELAEYLVRQGHQVDLVTGKWNSDWPEIEKINGVTIYRVPVIKLRYMQTLWFVWPQYKKARSLLKLHRYDFVHAHIFPSLITGALLPRAVRKIVTIQGGDLADYPEIYGPFRALTQPIISNCLKKYDQIHCVSQSLKKEIYALSQKKAIVLPNGVDSEIFIKKLNKLNNTILKKLPQVRYLIVSTSRLTNKNNLENTIKAIKIVIDRGWDVALVIAGTGHLQARLEDLTQQLDLSTKVFFLGALEHKQVLALVFRSNLFVRISLQEGFGISVLEAMALGIPVVASRSGGLADFVSSRTAWVPKSATEPKAIAEAIILALQAEKSVKVNPALEMVKAKFTWEKTLAEFTDKIYQLAT